MTSDEAYRLSFQKLRVHKQQFGAILRVGLPAGIQNCVFSMSNVIIQSSINSFGSVVIAGNSAAGNIEGFIYTAMNSIHHATVTATAQNMGAKQEKRVYQSLRVNIMLVIVVGLVLGILVVLFREPLLGIYSSDPAVIAAGARRNPCYWVDIFPLRYDGGVCRASARYGVFYRTDRRFHHRRMRCTNRLDLYRFCRPPQR